MNVGNVGDLVSIDIVVTDAHRPAEGVKVYTWVPITDVLIIAGDQVPVMGNVLVDNIGNKPGASF